MLACWCLPAADAGAQQAQPDIVEQIDGDAPAPAASGDLVESIGDDTELDMAASAAAAPPLQAPTEAVDRVELHGWVRQALELGFAQDVLRASRPDPTALPYDQLVARTQLLARARYAHGQWFEVNLSGVLSYSFFEQGSADPAHRFNGFNGQALRAVLEPQLRELHLGFFSRRFDLRIGQQRIAWGRGEFISPNDVLNARDTRDPIVGEAELRSLPTPLVRADLDLEFATLQGVFAPLYVPDRFDVFGANWAGVQPDAPREVRGLFGMLSSAIDPSLLEPLQRLLQGTKLPSSDLTQPTTGARLSWSAGNFDVSHYYHFGFDGPYVQIDPRVTAALAASDFSTAGLQDLQPLFRLIDAGEQPIRVTYLRRHHVGLDVATIWGPFALRVDAAFQSKRAFFRRDLQSTTSPTFQVVAAIEYQTGETDRLLLVEGMYMRLIDPPTTPLLIWKQDSIGVAALLRWSLWGPLGMELRAMFGIRPTTQVLQPQLDFKLDAWVISLGGVWLHGEAFSFGGYFHRNREVYLKLKWAF